MVSDKLTTLVRDGIDTANRVSDYIGVSRQTFSKYCNGESIPRADILEKICRYFGVSADWMLDIKQDTDCVGEWQDIYSMGRSYERCAACGDTWEVRTKHCPHCGRKMINGDFEGYDIKSLMEVLK